MAVDKQDVPASVDRPASIAAKQAGAQKRLESLLLDDSDSIRAVEDIADREVKVVGAGKTSHFASLLVLLLFCILLLGVGYYYLGARSSQQPPADQLSYYVSPKLPIPARPKIAPATAVDTVAEKASVTDLNIVSEKKADLERKSPVVTPPVAIKTPLFTVTVGPFINDVELHQAINLLQGLGFQSQKKSGRGQVTMIRLLEGVYPAQEAQIHLAALKKIVKSAFRLSDGDNVAVYAGSFHEEGRAHQMQDNLAQEMINVSLVDSDVTMNGTMLVALQADQQTAREVAAHISSLGLHTQLVSCNP